jgi:hypothetical protein
MNSSHPPRALTPSAFANFHSIAQPCLCPRHLCVRGQGGSVTREESAPAGNTPTPQTIHTHTHHITRPHTSIIFKCHSCVYPTCLLATAALAVGCSCRLEYDFLSSTQGTYPICLCLLLLDYSTRCLSPSSACEGTGRLCDKRAERHCR